MPVILVSALVCDCVCVCVFVCVAAEAVSQVGNKKDMDDQREVPVADAESFASGAGVRFLGACGRCLSCVQSCCVVYAGGLAFWLMRCAQRRPPRPLRTCRR